MLNLRISQKLYGVIALLIICIGVLGGVSSSMLKQVAGINDQAAAALAHVAMLDELEIAHLDWALELANSLNLEQSFTGQLDHTRCALGSWYYAFIESAEFASLSPELQAAYAALVEPHEALHRSAGEISGLLAAGGSAWEEARRSYAETTLVHLQAVRSALDRIIVLVQAEAAALEQEAQEVARTSQLITLVMIGVALGIALFLGF